MQDSTMKDCSDSRYKTSQANLSLFILLNPLNQAPDTVPISYGTMKGARTPSRTAREKIAGFHP